MIALIAAVAKNGVIGKNDRIPWHIPGEQKRFKELTMGQSVIMGRISYEEIGHPLPGRELLIVSRTKCFDTDGVRTFPSLRRALDHAAGRDVYIAGGGQLYREALPLCDRLYVTEIDAEVEGDVFFPAFDPSGYEKTSEPAVDGALPYRYVTYTRK